MADEQRLSDGVGFATLKPTFSDASAQLVELMRATLRHAQEITAAVGEAEGAAEQAQGAVVAVTAATADAERRVVESEIERLSASLFSQKLPEVAADSGRSRLGTFAPASMSAAAVSAAAAAASNTASVAASSASAAAVAAPTAATASAAAAPEEPSESSPCGTSSSGAVAAPLEMSPASAGHAAAAASTAAAPPPAEPAAVLAAPSLPLGPVSRSNVRLKGGGGGGPRSITSQMTEEIETTVMWVQQLLESVHFIDSDTALEPGASLLSIVQPGRRHQKDEALHQSLTLFHEKKEEEEEADEHAIFFRKHALQAVAAQRSQLSSRE